MIQRERFDRSRMPDPADYLAQHVTLPKRIPANGWALVRCCFHDDRTPSLSVNVETGGFACHACGAKGGDPLAFHQLLVGRAFLDAARDLGCMVGDGPQDAPALPPKRPQAPRQAVPRDTLADDEKRALAARLWRSAQPLAGSPGADYLHGRGCAIPPADGDLRFLPALSLYGLSGPALVGQITDAETAKGIGLHVTWLAHDGGRWHRTERRYVGAKAGGVVRLWPDESVTHGLSIAEGIETALAAARLRTPVWACLDAGNVAALPVLAGIESLTIFADRDASGTGQRAAADCAQRWLTAGREVQVFAAEEIGTDAADKVAACAA